MGTGRSADDDPLILTARFDEAAAGLFTRLRDTHFPPALNIVPAHCTLFHHLPGAEAGSVSAALRSATAGEPPIPFTTAGLRFLGRGVAVEIAAPALLALRGRLSAAFRSGLTAQDAQGFRPHVTVQNKVAPEVARALLGHLRACLPPLDGTVTGLDLWRYRSGPWEAAGFFPFGA